MVTQIMLMKVKKELKLVQINMKKIIFIFIIIWAQSSYAQKKVNLLEEDEEIKSILSSNFLPISYPDSIAFHSFYIKITPTKKQKNKKHLYKHCSG